MLGEEDVVVVVVVQWRGCGGEDDVVGKARLGWR